MARQGAELVDAAGIGTGRGAADGRDVGQAAQAQHAFDEGVVPILALVAQFAVAEEEMDDEEQHDHVVAEDRVRGHVAEARA